MPTSPARIDITPSRLSTDDPGSTQSSPLQDAQRPFSEDDTSFPSLVNLPGRAKLGLDEAMDTTRRAPRGSISIEEIVHFNEYLFETIHPTMVEHLSDPFLAMLESICTNLSHNTSEIIEDSQQASSETIMESATAQALGQEANVALLEKSINHESSLLRDDISHLKVLTQTIHRFQLDLAANLSPSSRILTQLQHLAWMIGKLRISKPLNTKCIRSECNLRKAHSYKIGSNGCMLEQFPLPHQPLINGPLVALMTKKPSSN